MRTTSSKISAAACADLRETDILHTEIDGHQVFIGTASRALDADNKSVVFVHGAGMDHSIWVMPARHFARHEWNVVAPDLPGHGRSNGPALDSIDDMATWLTRLLDQLQIESAAIVGHSMGSLIALSFAVSQPARVTHLALLGPSEPMPVADQLLDAAKENSHDAIDMANTWSHSPRGRLGANPNPGLWMYAGGERLLERAGDGVFYNDLRACNGFEMADEQLAEIRRPTLVISGTGDLMTPARRGAKLASHISNTTLLTLQGCGHAMLSERPNEVLDALHQLLAE